MCIRDSLDAIQAEPIRQRDGDEVIDDGKRVESVSYTHLDVYKRQAHDRGADALIL